MFLAHPKIGTHPAPELVVKRLLPTAREQATEFDLLEREAELHRAVHHENVVAVYGAGMVANEPYLAMEYVEGVESVSADPARASRGNTLAARPCGLHRAAGCGGAFRGPQRN